MYTPDHFAQPQVSELHRLIAENPLGALITNGPNGLDANHMPFELDTSAGEAGHLVTHVARANPVWEELKDGEEVLVVFRGGEAYISPNWYPSKHDFHQQVPTWNYQVVHVHGKAKIRDDEKFVRGVVARLTRVNEVRAGMERPWKMTDSSREFIDQMLQAIVGIEVEVTQMVGKWKLSQNKEARDRLNAAKELHKRGEQEISAAMEKTVGSQAGQV